MAYSKPPRGNVKVESVAIADLAFDPANARKHEKKNLDAIRGSLAKFGQQKPIVVGTPGFNGRGITECSAMIPRRAFTPIDAHYCDVILARWEKFTGLSASRAEAS